MSGFTVDTYKMTQYANRIDSTNKRITKLDRRLDKLYRQVGLLELYNLIQADALTGYSWRLNRCENYLRQTASDFEAAERQILKFDPDNIKMPKMLEVISHQVQTAHTLSSEEEAILLAATEEMIRCIGSTGIEALKKEIKSIPDDIRSAGEVLSIIEDKYKELPRDITFAIDVFVPGTLKDAYTITSGIFQGDLTWEEALDAGKSIAVKNTKLGLILETFDYTITTAKDIDDEMMEDVMKQLKEGDIIGAFGDATEGFIDGVLGGTIKVIGDYTGDRVDDFIDDVPGVKYLNKFFEYSTGMLDMNEGEGYSIGGLISETGEAIFEGIDTVTDYASDKLNEVTDVVTNGVKSGIKWVSGLFS